MQTLSKRTFETNQEIVKTIFNSQFTTLSPVGSFIFHDEQIFIDFQSTFKIAKTIREMGGETNDQFKGRVLEYLNQMNTSFNEEMLFNSIQRFIDNVKFFNPAGFDEVFNFTFYRHEIRITEQMTMRQMIALATFLESKPRSSTRYLLKKLYIKLRQNVNHQWAYDTVVRLGRPIVKPTLTDDFFTLNFPFTGVDEIRIHETRLKDVENFIETLNTHNDLIYRDMGEKIKKIPKDGWFTQLAKSIF